MLMIYFFTFVFTHQLTNTPPLQLSYSTMCRWRHVRNVYLRCGHAESLVKCTSTRCKFSPNHPSNCVPPACSTSCNQYHLFPEHYNPNIDGYCSSCRSGGSGRRRY
ncbi:hypothetical protein B0H19DRAFT_1121137 [Mycena capillaripes]|nr:hypothetical protein B0H19DRAFT_1121137 [Mycena capillaripes]